MSQDGDSCKSETIGLALPVAYITPFSVRLVEHTSTCTSQRDTPPARSWRATTLRLRHIETRLQHSIARIRALPHPVLEHRRLLLSRRGPTLPESTSAQLCAVPLTALRYWRTNSHGIRSPITYSLHKLDRPMSATILDRCVPRDARIHRYGQRDGRRGH